MFLCVYTYIYTYTTHSIIYTYIHTCVCVYTHKHTYIYTWLVSICYQIIMRPTERIAATGASDLHCEIFIQKSM